ncbi:MAG TPA: amino acid permease [Vicinamibacterales bacterium]|nr:amino acid permease [Vicinamibacterales bacterium]
MAGDFKRALGPFDATMVVIGGIIGAGIFLSPGNVAQRLDTPLLVLAAWGAGGLIALAGAFSYAELGAIFPKAGGQYVYLRDGLHPLAGFMYGWALLLVIETGAIAAVAIIFASYALRIVGGPDGARVPLAIAAIVLLSIINYLGVKPGSRVLNVLVLLKVAALAILIGAGFAAAGHPGWWTDARVTAAAGQPTLVAFGAALVPILFSYGGWQSANYVGEEIADPKRNLPRALIAGTLAVVVIYVTVNVVYLRALGLEGLATSPAPAAEAARRTFGAYGDVFVSSAIAISTFGFLNLSILAPTRVYYAMAADRLFVPALAALHPRYATPSLAIIVQSTWSCILALTGSYDSLLNYVVFADWIFFGLTVLTVLMFRRSLPLSARAPDTFRAPGYPVVQIAFVAIAAAVVASTIGAAPAAAAKGAALIALGIPVYYWYARRTARGGPSVR